MPDFYDSNPSIQRQHLNPNDRQANHNYVFRDGRGQTSKYADLNSRNSRLNSPVAPAPVDTYDEAAVEAANYNVPPVYPGEGKELTEDLKRAYVDRISQTGLVYQSAAILGLEYSTVEYHLKRDGKFSQSVDIALRHYGERLQQTVASRGLYGWLEPHYDDRGNQVGFVRKYDHKLLQYEATRTNPGYKDKSQDAAKIGLPKRETSSQAWYNKYANV